MDASQPGFATTIENLRLRSWKLGAGQAMDVIGQFPQADFTHIVDDRADVHVSSRDGRFYLGYFPNGRPGGPDEDWVTGEGWVIAVTGTEKVPGYRIAFSTETPAMIVADAVARILASSRPL
ncbi:DUF317 domain-containing protein [Streptomyces sp. GXMU-J15]|uniref:DUF317 domain-containing protein n=1 Tax=Streptomyces fuscus TaxID=3048495 RepID=A0ABT7IT79_9ACTN|nr:MULTISPECIES: DUF317 domain-containing protein [Streptomyces]MDL2075784.1 DUF317 domain-containing protein [Streptomyces fuscus]SBT93345.1 protein of unknown function [Streptomyces sp. DI166]